MIFITLCNAQNSNHLYNHTFPDIDSQNPKVLEMLENVENSQIADDVNHLASYINRRCDGSHIYDVKDWLVVQYQSFGLDSVWLHDFPVMSCWDTVPKPFTTAPNVIGVQIGKTKPNEIIICGAHYDSWVRAEEPYDVDTLVSPGADDNASGVAGILETARILSNYEFERTIYYACWNAEEVGLCGSYNFAKDCHNDSVDIVAYFNLDMTGYVYPGDDIHIHLLYKNCDSLLGKFVQQVGNTYLPEINICHAWLQHGDTDYSSFNRNGYQAISPSEDVYHLSPYIHTVEDIVGLSVNSWEQSAVFTKLNLASVAHAAGLISESVDENYVDIINVYPNPTKDYVYIDLNSQNIDNQIYYYDIVDILGRKTLHGNLWKNMEEIRVSDLVSGIYIIRFYTKEGSVLTNKIFVKY